MNVFTFKVCVVMKQISESTSESFNALVTVAITEYTVNSLELCLVSRAVQSRFRTGITNGQHSSVNKNI